MAIALGVGHARLRVQALSIHRPAAQCRSSAGSAHRMCAYQPLCLPLGSARVQSELQPHGLTPRLELSLALSVRVRSAQKYHYA